jgi:putative FmdB family regulatory protein
MPIYAYQCTQCGKDEEYIQKFSDPPMEKCEHCGGPLRRLVTSAAFHLKGGGWYKDLYASSKPGEGSGGGSTTPAAESKPASKPESKPESKPASKPASSGSST